MEEDSGCNVKEWEEYEDVHMNIDDSCIADSVAHAQKYFVSILHHRIKNGNREPERRHLFKGMR
jgi:hypothetical protein